MTSACDENKMKEKKKKRTSIDYLLTVRLKSVSLQAQYDIGRLDFGIINLSEIKRPFQSRLLTQMMHSN